MTAVLVVEKEKTISNYSLLLRAALHDREIMSSVAIRKVVNLMSKSRMWSMHFTQTRTYFYLVDIDAGKGFLNAAFKHVIFTLSTDSGLSYGGLLLVHHFLKEVVTLAVYVLLRVPSSL